MDKKRETAIGEQMKIILPCNDDILRNRLMSLFKVAENTFEWTPIERVADDRRRVVIDHLLNVLSEHGYHKDKP